MKQGTLEKIQNLAVSLQLVTVEDMRKHSLPQLVTMIANKLNELMNEVHRFETDVIEMVETQNENIQYLLGEGLHLEVATVFEGWMEDGTFDTLINQSALKKVNDRIDETNAQLSDVKQKIPFVNVVNEGAKNDGITDNYNILTEIIKKNKKATLYFPNGIYKISNTLKIDSDVSIEFDTNATLTTDVSLNALVEYNVSYSSPNPRVLNKICLDGNGKCGTVLNIKGASGLYINDASIVNPISVGIDINSDGISSGSTHEVFIKNCKIDNRLNGTSVYDGVGLLVRTSDCHFTNIVVIDMKTAVKVTSGANVFTGIHPWCRTFDVYKGSVGIQNEAVANTFCNSYMDSVEIGFKSSRNAVINNFNFRIGDVFLQKATTNPIFIMNDGDIKIEANGCYFENSRDFSCNPIMQYSKNIKLINPRISKPNFFHDQFHEYKTIYQKNYRCNFSNIGISSRSYTDKEISIHGLKYNDVFSICNIGDYLTDGVIVNFYLKEGKLTARFYNTTDASVNISKYSVYLMIYKENIEDVLDYTVV